MMQISKDTWPCVQWEADEGALVLAATNTLQVYSQEDRFAGACVHACVRACVCFAELLATSTLQVCNCQ